jgi:tRNA A-37 threonylcarbamoyl transferase component Bud32
MACTRTAAILAAAALASPALAFAPAAGVMPQQQQHHRRTVPALRSCGGPRRHAVAVRMESQQEEVKTGTRLVNVGGRPDASALTGPNNGLPSSTITKSDKPQPNKAVLDALSVSSWWKHDAKHRTVVNGDELAVDYNQMLGDGTYGEVFMAEFTAGKHKGKKAVVKRAKDGTQDPLDPVKYVKKERSKQMVEHDELAAAYLSTESYINDLVMESCPNACAPYLGMMTKQGKRWLVWEFLEGTTLEDLLLECDECYSLQPLAKALGINDLVDGDMPSLRRLVNLVARQLLKHCLDLEKAGVAHRDIKPFNIFVSKDELLLIDFGSAAAMGIRERVGYDYNKSPCDPRYAPPEQFIDEAEWAKYDVYCVGLILVRVRVRDPKP